jgi:two-component system NtrC family response regulator
MKKNLLIIEDEPSLAKQLKWGLSDIYEATVTGDATHASHYLALESFPVAILDLGLPPHPDTPQEGLRLLESLPSIAPNTKVIVITGNDEQENALKAVAQGATDFCAKPVDLEVLKVILDRAFRIHALEEAGRSARECSSESIILHGLVGASSVMEELFRLIRQVSPTDYPVLIQGESGTGKDLVARAIHALSRRSKAPLVIINCAAIPDNLLESELFGHEKGSFTGAVARKIGKFEQANKGTLFMDEIGDMPLDLQAKLLRFLQEGTIERVGGTCTLTIDVRIIAATNVDLEKARRQGRFREDLFYRLNVVPIVTPPLQEHREDILLLAQHFIKEESRMLKRGRIKMSPAAAAVLSAHSWPGNVRELQNRIRRALATAVDNVITPVNLGLADAEPPPQDLKPLTLKEARDVGERQAIELALARTGNNISRAAKLLKISRPTLHDLLNKHGLG